VGAVSDLADLAPNVFISYAHTDKPFAHRLAGVLGERGCGVWVDEFELRAGDSLTERISGAVTTADFVVTLVSSASVESNWCRRELQMALATGLSEGRTIVLPVRLGSVAMPPAISDIVYIPADHGEPEIAAERLTADMLSHAADLDARRRAQVTERQWQFAAEPAHELDGLLGDLEREMDYLFTPGLSRKGRTTYSEAWARWSGLVDKWAGGSRLPGVLSDLAWRLEDLLATATEHDAAYRTNKGIRRRLERIVGFGIIETRELMSSTVQHPEILASTVLEDSSIPQRDELAEMVANDPRLFTLRDRIVPAAELEADVEPPADESAS
jgi:hypothetical protein